MNIKFTTILLLGSCLGSCHASIQHKARHEDHRIYHFTNGVVGYRDANSIWWYMSQQSWEKGPSPSPDSIQGARVSEEQVDVNENGQPQAIGEEEED